ncbi:TetR/AcrR family transcriptional regulator [Pseudomonas sp. NPDC089547]|uniref:TetR/AcrR family transcriptional regulator n=1 Tax=Pseudomonas sp. NPDC089547 TaxID=3390652 RepID=UPI003CFE7854
MAGLIYSGGAILLGEVMTSATREALISTAESLMRTKGYAAFSYADLAEAVGIRKASIHYHFPSKEDLGKAIVEEYLAKVKIELDNIEGKYKATEDKLNAFFALFNSSTEDGLLPLCGALAAEMAALPIGLQHLTKRFFELQLNWLKETFEQGISAEGIPAGRGAHEKSHLLLSILEGSSFINWAMKDNGRIDPAVLDLVVKY